MFKNFLLKQMLKKQLKGIPEAEQDRIIGIIEKNPDLFTKIAHEVDEKKKGGMPQHDAMMSTMKKYQAELQKIMGQ